MSVPAEAVVAVATSAAAVVAVGVGVAATLVAAVERPQAAEAITRVNRSQYQEPLRSSEWLPLFSASSTEQQELRRR